MMVRPANHTKVDIHGNISKPDPKTGSIQFHTNEARIMEWPFIFGRHNVTVHERESFTVASRIEAGVHNLENAVKETSKGEWTMHYDDKLAAWFDFVASRKAFALSTGIHTVNAPKEVISSDIEVSALVPFSQKSRAFSDAMDAVDVGWGDKPPENWTVVVCPEVVDHFQIFPSFSRNIQYGGKDMPVQTTHYAVHTVCTFKIAKMVAASINTGFYLHAGSHLGAVLHGQPIPWDDDADAFMDYNKRDSFKDLCTKGVNVYLGVKLQCVESDTALKIWLHVEGMPKGPSGSKYPWYSPYVDLFFYKKKDGYLWEVLPDGAVANKRHSQHYAIQDYFPTTPYYFGGITVLDPPSVIAERRYKTDICKVSNWNHRREYYYGAGGVNVDCDQMKKNFPFRYGSDKISNGARTLTVFPIQAASAPLTIASIEQRREWANISDSTLGQELTNEIPNLDVVEIDNTISPHDECSGKKLKVIEFNAERGRWWLGSASRLQDFDVVILNEMDIG